MSVDSLNQDVKSQIDSLLVDTKKSSLDIAKTNTETKNSLLVDIANNINESRTLILSNNEKDLNLLDPKNFSLAFYDRLKLDNSRIDQMIQNINEVIDLDDPVRKNRFLYERPNGLKVFKQSIPLGVICIIYESRPNVTSDAASLCLKSGNSVLLRGGSECFNTNKILVKIIQKSLIKNNINQHSVNLVPHTDREVMKYILKKDEDVDLIIPRGGEGLIRFVSENSSIPVIKHYKGVCHVYLDSEADLKIAHDVAINSKIQRPGVCNAMETLIINKNLPKDFISNLLNEFINNKVLIYGEDELSKYIGNDLFTILSPEYYHNEYLDMKLNIKLVSDIDQAIKHIEEYGSLHTESIVTSDERNKEIFIKSLNSSAIFHNASTRFNDGNELGLGAEIGISTTKLHAFGPMGLNELTSEKFVVYGSGQIK
ncbi:glutamate-5-semialdehyde dehydrogenase [bacterium]|nr:glutamate-5-semialdehyde dehydrogenase [bacterium]|tara:strand:- start:2890 stop:4170 length:1281 start_codon:yes stop_codon:yes gene_type:complete